MYLECHDRLVSIPKSKSRLNEVRTVAGFEEALLCSFINPLHAHQRPL